LLAFIFAVISLAAEDSEDRFIRLIVGERDGSFSLFYLADQGEMRYEPLLYRNASTSFLSVNVDGRVFQLGKSREFSTRIDSVDGNPAVIYESSFLTVSKVFTTVRTTNSPNSNGIRVTINIENKSDQDVSVGLRILLDTHLGEGRGGVPFNTDTLEITRETIVSGSSGESYWITRGTDISLMGNIGNIFNDGSKAPDFLHFANWKKLNDVPWRAPYREGSSFNSIPFSIGDSAVCYYYEPDVLPAGRSFRYSIFLTTEDTAWYQRTVEDTSGRGALTINIAAIEDAARLEANERNEDADLLILYRLRDLIDQFITGKILLNEQDLLEIERSIEKYKR
jgi:hypothetical protein